MRDHAEKYKQFLDVKPGGGTRRIPKRKTPYANSSQGSRSQEQAEPRVHLQILHHRRVRDLAGPKQHHRRRLTSRTGLAASSSANPSPQKGKGPRKTKATPST
ncbi:hypothetical protein EJ08DRAFT_701788 [Tothia fuscella]|uniref:Uncharacterized protein n=1 Tax=Tothia fuscella TaxID=1048955 RepID=A0A9P4NHV2_9PEZI|nr:hypothetical protein EJ08DRAFT_701788 [Tothia fuscella]